MRDGERHDGWHHKPDGCHRPELYVRWVRRFQSEGKPLPGNWLLDSEGHPTNQPSALFSDPPGTVLPLGGTDVGYKGFGLALMG